MRPLLPLLLACATLACATPAGAALAGATPATAQEPLQASVNPGAVQVTDDLGASIALARPAGRVISLAPHATELLFAAGGGRQVIAVSRFSNYPPAAQALPQVGDATRVDLEALLALHPDLVVAWSSGLPPGVLAVLQERRIPVYRSEPHTLEEIATSLERLGQLLGTTTVAKPAATAFRQQVAALRKTYAQRSPVSVFLQTWAQPLMTLNGTQPASELVALCGGRTLFADARLLAPTVDAEAVVAADPEVIISTGAAAEQQRIFARWLAFPHLRAVARRHLLLLDGDRFSRAGPRLLELAPEVCAALDDARRAPAGVTH